MENKYVDFSLIFKALSDETRLKIVDMLSCGELCACEILESFHITQPTLSYHMKILTDSGMVIGNRKGTWMHYSINSETANQLSQYINKLTSNKEDCICHNNNKLDCSENDNCKIVCDKSGEGVE